LPHLPFFDKQLLMAIIRENKLSKKNIHAENKPMHLRPSLGVLADA
jgi:hypothetical protein